MSSLRSILVYERLCAVPPNGAADPTGSLAAEGQAMLRAAAGALLAVAGVEVSACAAADFGPWARLPPDRFPAAAGEFDAVLLIAPEIDGLAARLAAETVAAGGRLLGPDPALVALAADKIATAAALGALAPPSVRVEDAARFHGLIVVKPRDGVGGLFTIAGPAGDAGAIAQALRAAGCRSDLFVQPKLVGVPASVALLGRGGKPPFALPAVGQRIDERPHAANPAWSEFHYLGGTLPLAEPWQARALRLAARAAARLPAWTGYLGIDLLLTAAGDFVLDVNPRLTTSFLGYDALLPGRMGRFLLGAETAADRAAARSARTAAPIGFAP